MKLINLFIFSFIVISGSFFTYFLCCILAFSKMKALLLEYGQTSTIAGLRYVFLPKQRFLVRIIWIIAVVILTLLGTWLSVKSYLECKENPVLTTITTTGRHLAAVLIKSCWKTLTNCLILGTFWLKQFYFMTHCHKWQPECHFFYFNLSMQTPLKKFTSI